MMTEGQDIQDGLEGAHHETLREEMIESVGGHEGPFYVHAEFWLAMEFILVVALLFMPVSKLIKRMMGKRIQGIADRIDEVSQLKTDAQKLLAEYERKFGNAETEAYQILEKAKREIDMIKTEKLGKLERNLKQREKEAVIRIERASSKAVAEVVALSSDLAIETVKDAIGKKMSDETKDRLIEQSIANLDKTG